MTIPTIVRTTSTTKEEYDEQLLTSNFASHKKALLFYAFSRLNDPMMSEDLVQDTFTKAWSYLMRGGEVGSMEAFLYHILKGLIIDEYRKRKATSLDVLIQKGFDPGIDSSMRTIDVFDGKIAVNLIKILPKNYRKIMRMKYLEGLSLKEISEVTGQTKNTIAVQMHRGLKKLRFLYEQASQKHSLNLQKVILA